MKYEEFEGSLGEFLDSFLKGQTFYTREKIEISIINDSVRAMKKYYNNGVYIKKEEDWADHLPVLCWVSDYPVFKDEDWALVLNRGVSGWLCSDGLGNSFYKEYAQPVTQEEIDKMIWKGGL